MVSQFENIQIFINPQYFFYENYFAYVNLNNRMRYSVCLPLFFEGKENVINLIPEYHLRYSEIVSSFRR